jgi:hypothetical protein
MGAAATAAKESTGGPVRGLHREPENIRTKGLVRLGEPERVPERLKGKRWQEARMRSWLIAAAAAVMLTGCAAGPAAVPTGTRTAATGTVLSTGSRAKAIALAEHLVAEVRVPPGTRPAHLNSLPPSLSAPPTPAGPGWASATRVLVAPGNAIAVVDALVAHAPFGDGAPGRVPVTVSTELESPEPGVDAAVVDVSVMQYSRTTTLLAVRASAAWLPVRTAAEHLDPDRIRAVVLTETFDRSSADPPVRRTFAHSVIARLAALLNQFTPAVLELASCPAPSASFTLTFEPLTGNSDTVVVSTFGCGFDDVTADGAAQPALSDPDDRLLALARELAGSFGSG